MTKLTENRPTAMPQKFYLILAYLLAIAHLPAQNAQVGEPVITNYNPHEYTKFVDNITFLDNLAKQDVKGGLSSGWSVAQTNSGKLYFGTTAGVLEFDGYKWDMIFLMNSTNKDLVGARSLCYDKNIDRLYVGAHNDFGYLEKGKNGKMTFVSLYEKFKEKIKKAVGKDIDELWSVRIHKGEVYFHSRFALMIYNSKDIRVIPTQESYHRLFSVQQKLYLRQEGIGLCRLENDKLTPLPFGEMFAKSPNFQISGMIPYYKGGMLIGSRREGLFIYGEYGSTKDEVFSKQGISPEVDNRLKEAQIYHIRQLADGKIAVGTLRDGLFILDKDLQLLYHFNEEKGLQASSILYIFQDKINNVWVITFKGIAKIELNSPLTRWDKGQNMNTRLNDAVKYKGDIYVSCNTGVLRLNKQTNRFEPVKGILTQAWQFAVVKMGNTEQLVVGADNVYRLVGATFVPTLQLTGRIIFSHFGTSLEDERILYAFPSTNKMLELLCENDKITLKQTVEFPPEIQSWDNTTADAHNNLWSAIPEDSTGKFVRLYSIKENKVIRYFYRKDFPKLPAYHPNQRMQVEMHVDFNKQILCNVNGQNYRYDEKQERFVLIPYYLRKYNLPDSAYYRFFGNIIKQDYMVSMTKDFAWHFLVVPQSDGSYKIDSIPNKYFNENGYRLLFSDHEKREMWFSGQDALYKYNANIKQTYNRTFPTYLRAVYPLYNPDSLSVHEVFGDNPKSYWQLPYQQNKLRFEFSAVDFSSKGDIQYRYFLEGNDAQWSGWTAESYKEYTNLPEGIYTFHVQALNHYGFVGQPASFTFTILAPWYRTWWAYTLYVIVAGLGLYALIYLNLRRLRQYNEYLTRLVRERTKEIEEQNQEITAQAEELRQSNDEILAQKEEIESQRDLLEKQNHEVMDSITYGSRIQNAILPFRDRIEKTLDEHFVLFQPRDVVSGDFYWFHDTNPEDRKVGKAIIAVADCTGHGVPGAFMSMIGNQILYELVIQKHCIDCDLILNMLHKEVRRTLRQYETENRDGMDIGLVVWDKEKHLLEFSGAKNTLVYFLQGEMQTIRGDKMPIGGEQREEERIFTKNIINLPTNGEKLTFYLYSDGFQDQFGGEHNKKFSPQRMRDLFKQIHTLQMAEQEYTLLHTITQWRNEGKERQTDDILVWGTRL